ncbi:MAG: hypothetical protein ACRDUV_27390 [Pseudonocardiaceae bacterium]
MLLALGAGVIAGLTKSVVSLVDDGVLAMLTSWEINGLAVTAAGAQTAVGCTGRSQSIV